MFLPGSFSHVLLFVLEIPTSLICMSSGFWIECIGYIVELVPRYLDFILGL